MKSTFLSLFSNTNFLPSIYHPILYKFLNNSQIKHWDKDIFYFSRAKIQEIESNIGKERIRSLLSNLNIDFYNSTLTNRMLIGQKLNKIVELGVKKQGISVFTPSFFAVFLYSKKLKSTYPIKGVGTTVS